MNRYPLHLLAATFTLLFSVAAINWLADPYVIFGTPIIRGVNAVKPEFETHRRISEMISYTHQKIDALILGTSRADRGLSPKHEAFKNMRTLNLAMPAQKFAETTTIFKFVSDRSTLKTAVIGLDFFASNALLPAPPDYSLDNFSDDLKFRLLFSKSTLQSSKKTLFQFGEEGVITPDMARMNGISGVDKSKFTLSENIYMCYFYLPPPKFKYLFEDDYIEKGELHQVAPLDDMRSLIALAYQRHIKLHLFISPSHARQWETLAAMGLWNKWEDWKRRLVQINDKEAQHAGQNPFPLWDFSGYNSITTEALPTLRDEKKIMRWYFDTSHYTPATGDLVLDRIFSLKSPERIIPDDFGVLLTSHNIDVHLANIQVAREHYRQTHPDDVSEIEGMASEVAKTKQCQAYPR